MCHGTIILKLEATGEAVTVGLLQRLEAARQAIAGEIKAELTQLGYHDVDTVDETEPVFKNGVAETSEIVECHGLGESGQDINDMQANLEGIAARFVERLEDLAEIIQDHSLGEFSQVIAWLENPYADGEEDFDEEGNPTDDEEGDGCGC